MDKTNVMKMLDKKKIEYKGYTYGNGEEMSGTEVAKLIGKDADEVFKTLVTVGKSGKNYVFVVPSSKELDLKKAAKAAGEKSIEMIKSKELLPLTGYVHGGWSPVGRKKQFPTVFQESGREQDASYVSAGKIGLQVEVAPQDWMNLVRATAADVIVDE